MGGYTNGRFPLSMLVHLGGKVYLPAGTAARWRWLVAQALVKYGVELYITPGWNGYRPFDVQVQYRKDLGIWAATPGYSSHGLIYRGQLVAAIDVANWRDLAPGNEALAWTRFKALCRLAGFTVDFVSPQELWHIGDFNDVWTPPGFAAGNITAPKPGATAILEELTDMDKALIVQVTTKTGITWALVGATVPGGYRTTRVQETANAWAVIYGPGKKLDPDAYDIVIREVKALAASWLAQQKLIHG